MLRTLTFCFEIKFRFYIFRKIFSCLYSPEKRHIKYSPEKGSQLGFRHTSTIYISIQKITPRQVHAGARAGEMPEIYFLAKFVGHFVVLESITVYFHPHVNCATFNDSRDSNVVCMLDNVWN